MNMKPISNFTSFRLTEIKIYHLYNDIMTDQCPLINAYRLPPMTNYFVTLRTYNQGEAAEVETAVHNVFVECQ